MEVQKKYFKLLKTFGYIEEGWIYKIAEHSFVDKNKQRWILGKKIEDRINDGDIKLLTKEEFEIETTIQKTANELLKICDDDLDLKDFIKLQEQIIFDCEEKIRKSEKDKERMLNIIRKLGK